MRKNFKRKNYVLFGAIGIAAVALSSVGFATWITGMQKLTDNDNEITVTVDTAKNDTKYIDVEISENKLYLGEPTSESQTEGQINITGGKASDLSISFSTFRVIVSDIYDESTISVSMNVSLSDSNKASYLSTKNGFAKKGGTDTYIEFPTTFVDDGNVKLQAKTSSLAGYHEMELKDTTINLTWGDTFGDGTKTPSQYYNEQLATKTTLDEKLELMSTATNTLKDMHTALNGQTITLSFEVTASLKGAQQS